LAQRLRQGGQSVTTLIEPGSTAIGRRLRTLILALVEPLTPLTEALLFASARAQLVTTEIEPALRENKIVLCDRFSSSTLAYQGFGKDVPLSALIALNVIACQGIEPTLTILLDLDPALGIQRKRVQSGLNPFENAVLQYSNKVRTGYLKLAQYNPHRWLIVDASQPIEDTHAQIYAHVSELLALPQSVKASPRRTD